MASIQTTSSTSSISRDTDFTSRDTIVSKFMDNGGHKRPSPRLREARLDDDELDAQARSFAERCWAEDETLVVKEKIAEWLGGRTKVKNLALKHYMSRFDFTDLRLDNAFRHLFAKLYLKAESQQVDRILEEFSRRYWDCNPGSLFGSASVVHAVAYSLLLLNTDLHIAELTSHMSKPQFVQNTLSVITDQVRPSNSASELPSPSDIPVRSSSPEPSPRNDSAPIVDPPEPSSAAPRMRSKRSGSLQSWKSASREGFNGILGSNISTPQLNTYPGLGTSNPSIPASLDSRAMKASVSSSISYGRAWKNDMESLLKEMYQSIKSQQILQPTPITERASMSALAPASAHGNVIARSRSVRSHTGQQDRLHNLKRGSIRGIQSLLGNQSQYSSNSSVDGRVSPSPSFATSIGDAISASTSSLFAPTLGFASNLSHTIIKEAQEDDSRSILSDDTDETSVSISDEELALLGAPWAKEGMLCRKEYWESTGKRSKNKMWMNVFVVIQKGQLSMFTFGEGSSTNQGGGVGGGNWLSNAQPVGSICLAHSLSHALPPPGYNRNRPHCFVLTLASDAVYFFQAGTEDLVNEWVSTCNYWAARLSKEPLAGGVSNMEYGWNRVIDSLDDNPVPDPPEDTFSVRSGRSKLSKKSWDYIGSGRNQYSPLVLEKVYIHDWKPPMTSTLTSTHDEETQMEALQKQVGLLKGDLVVHDKVQRAMQHLYIPRSSNALKAQANWEARSKYLMAEIFKYETYVDSLRSAMSLRLKRRGERVLERALVASPNEEDEALMGVSPGRVKPIRMEATIQETEEPATPGPGVSAFSMTKGGGIRSR